MTSGDKDTKIQGMLLVAEQMPEQKCIFLVQSFLGISNFSYGPRPHSFQLSVPANSVQLPAKRRIAMTTRTTTTTTTTLFRFRESWILDDHPASQVGTEKHGNSS